MAEGEAHPDEGMELFLSMTPQEREAAFATNAPRVAAMNFLKAAIGDGDTEAAWQHMHPHFRLCLAQWWLWHNRQQAQIDGYTDLAGTAERLASPSGASHALWPHFARVTTRLLRDIVSCGYGEHVGIGINPRPVSVDTELLYLHGNVDELPGGVHQAGQTAAVWPILMRLSGQDWGVLNVGSERSPDLGWPPDLHTGEAMDELG